MDCQQARHVLLTFIKKKQSSAKKEGNKRVIEREAVASAGRAELGWVSKRSLASGGPIIADSQSANVAASGKPGKWILQPILQEVAESTAVETHESLALSSVLV